MSVTTPPGMSVAVRRLLAAAAACAVGLMVVYVLSRRSGAAWWDERILEALSTRFEHYRFQESADALRGLFDVGTYMLSVAILLAAAFYRRLPGAAVLAGTMLLGANLTTWALQHRLGDSRVLQILDEPPWLSYWPSGHTTAAVALAFGVFLVSAPSWRPFVAVTVTLVAIPAVLTNLVLRVHVPSDVLGGILVASMWGFAALAAQQRWPALRPR